LQLAPEMAGVISEFLAASEPVGAARPLSGRTD
jgi:hypothetical protein